MSRLDAETVLENLDTDRLPEGVGRQELDLAIQSMAELAHRRMVIDQCGGLPGPPIERETLLRRIIGRRSAKLFD